MSYALYKTLMDTTFAPTSGRDLEIAISQAKSAGKPSLTFDYQIGNTAGGDFRNVDLSDAINRIQAADATLMKVEPVSSDKFSGYIEHAKLFITLTPKEAGGGYAYQPPSRGLVPVGTFSSPVAWDSSVAAKKGNPAAAPTAMMGVQDSTPIFR